MTNKKKLGLWTGGLVGVLVTCAVAVVLVMHSFQQPVLRESFVLGSEADEVAKFQDLTATEFEQMIDEKKSFVVILRMTVCPAEFPITDVAKQTVREDNLTIYGLMEEEFKQTELAERVKYLPSAAIYREGELVDVLDAEADEDLEYYKSVEGFEKWLRQAGVEL